MVINLSIPVKYMYNIPFLSKTNNLVARIGSKQNATKKAPIVNRVKSPDVGWLTVKCQALGHNSSSG